MSDITFMMKERESFLLSQSQLWRTRSTPILSVLWSLLKGRIVGWNVLSNVSIVDHSKMYTSHSRPPTKAIFPFFWQSDMNDKWMPKREEKEFCKAIQYVFYLWSCSWWWWRYALSCALYNEIKCFIIRHKYKFRWSSWWQSVCMTVWKESWTTNEWYMSILLMMCDLPSIMMLMMMNLFIFFFYTSVFTFTFLFPIQLFWHTLSSLVLLFRSELRSWKCSVPRLRHYLLQWQLLPAERIQ